MAIAITARIKTEPIRGQVRAEDIQWEVLVWDGGIREEWVAHADSFDEAIELTESLRKRYFVTMRSVPRS